MLTRHFTVATFVVRLVADSADAEILMLFHRKLKLWLPPGGHIEPNELPEEAAVREVLEETGVACVLVHEPPLVETAYPRQLARPAGIQLENIGASGADARHEHIDLIYFARPIDEAENPRSNGEGDSVGWYPLGALAELPAPPDVCQWAAKAARFVAEAGR